MKAVLTLLAILFSNVAFAGPLVSDLPKLMTGDIVFQESTSNQANAIMLSTDSEFSHVGVIEVKGGSIRVWEAVNPVRVIGLQQWINKGKPVSARNSEKKLLVLRMKKALTPAQQQMIVSGAAKYEHRPYDVFFSNLNNEIYCSELVDLAFKAAGLNVGKEELIGPIVDRSPHAAALLRARGQGHPLCSGKGLSQAKCEALVKASTLITPASMENDCQLEDVFRNAGRRKGCGFFRF